MKLFATLVLTMAALASAAAINSGSPHTPAEDAIVEREAEAALSSDPAYNPLARRDEGVDIVTQYLPDGSNKVEIVVDGVSNGYLIIGANGDGE
jgi:hypothetical protein